MIKILALAGVLSLVAMVTEGCTCFGPLHPQDAICNAPLMVRATVGDSKAFSYNKDRVLVEAGKKSHHSDKYRYELKINEIYASDGTINADTEPFYLYSNAYSGMCGISLNKSQEYVISMYSSYDTKLPSADICGSYVEKWVKIAEETRKNFNNQVYVDACKECKVKINPFGHDAQNDTCLYNPYLWNDASCLTDGRCLRQETGECDWNLKECQGEMDWGQRGYVSSDEVEAYSAESVDDDNDDNDDDDDDDDDETEEEDADDLPDVFGDEPDTGLSDEIDIDP
ncbi:metalloproteinase inhibitor 3-like [Lineus longissimus]|uniref:metalloproteinase inhibitor 3-like n=1 Tax=Lineus longissimus TaxID=88925 RepID=UPI002B4C95B3